MLIACLGLTLLAIESLTAFRPAGSETPYGPASTVEFSTRLADLEPGSLAHHIAGAMKNFEFGEKVWVVGYKTSIVNERGLAPQENFLCHTFFSDQRVDQHQENEMKGIYSDAFTPEVTLPPGYGIPLGPGERLHWMPMFNNRGETRVRVAMKVVLTVIRDRELKKPLVPVYASLRSVQVPHLYTVSSGRDSREITFDLPFQGRIHFLGTHVHPYGSSIELYNVTRGERVWVGRRKGNAPDSPMQTFSSADGYAVQKGETYRITAVYDNPLPHSVDAMSGLFMLYSRTQ